MNSKIKYSINHVKKFMTVQELNTQYRISELERTHLLCFLAKFVQIPQLDLYDFIRNCSEFLNVESCINWLHD